MDKNRAMLLWFAGAAGIVLLYAAYKGKSPSSIVSTYSDAKPATPSSGNPPGNATISPIGTPGTVVPQFTTDANGNMVDIPAAYQSEPQFYIPSANTA